MRMSLKTTLFRDLILSGSDTCIGLINSLIHRYLDDAASTDAISEKLRQVCPSLYRNEVKLLNSFQDLNDIQNTNWIFVNAGRPVYESERAIAESSNYDDESDGQGASITTDP